MTGRTVVIGGGAAGIAAARTLHDAGREVLLIEAADRLGGRARSVRLPTGHVVDHGCGWLHSAKRNPWTRIAQQAGFTIDRRRPNWQIQWNDLGFPPDQKRASGEAYARFETSAIAALDGPDRPLSDFVANDDPWQPMIDAVSGYANGASLAEVSLHDWAAYENAATDDNWAVVEGYGTVVAHHAAGLTIRTGATATRIDHRGKTIRIDTSAGTLEGDQVIVAVPTTVLAQGKLTFDPPLPAKQDAAAALPLGIADKVFLSVEGPLPWPAHAHLTGNPRSACTASHRLSPFGWPIVESFFGGPCAEALEEDGAATAFAIDELVALLGSNWRKRLTPLDATRWRRTPWVGGSYSHAKIGHAGSRQTLAEPVDGRLFFAGEACSHEDFSTAHGAYQTGVAAARKILSIAP
ncbi:flavin monoamine oxidase family protein [Sphingomonas sanguinis]|jgi:monoamine oxidase|uniref:Tryptophan 2-monooxygenase n=1 Tax=Sphingomonas sanguinis TaxID=33051 RepID=A0A7Y7QS16_9SPHN|nr:NAD(P)/FAD-dependent oxidoreductase [Sphingomonas sanguinis]MBZ6380133.1 FAD-dependent oxidoreductase [Sphingomonas sanguinis]NNG48762.1 FAD-dependent oxidoreductase [Sphingomonas sanguinis]NNG52009.1 FAD-dependent oxidoreductase [Sphingomonas sanguinis]NVP29434.1 FAD-dependent oxidoreductase [Sphingomonas sanguinis]